MTKPTKLQTLNESLVAAKAALESAKARLQPQITVASAELEARRTAYYVADKAALKAYDLNQNTWRAVEARLFPAATAKCRLAAIKAKVEAQFPQANFSRLQQELESRAVSADPEVVAASSAYTAASKARDAAYRTYNVSNATGPLVKLVQELNGFKERVERLENEIDRLPRYRQAAKARRAEERQEQVEADQTEAARGLLGDFKF